MKFGIHSTPNKERMKGAKLEIAQYHKACSFYREGNATPFSSGGFYLFDFCLFDLFSFYISLIF